MVTDTTMRDAHQSLLATRMRTADMLATSPRTTPSGTRTSSASRCGAGRPSTRACASSRRPRGTASRKLREPRPQRPVPDAACGPRAPSGTPTTRTTSSTPSSRKSADAGMDVFRIFDANNWLPNLRVGIDAVLKTDALCRGRHLLHRRHPRPEARQVHADVLRRSGQGTRQDARHAPARHQGHGWAAEALRREEAREGAAGGGRRADPLPHPRRRRRADRVVPDGRRGGR